MKNYRLIGFTLLFLAMVISPGCKKKSQAPILAPIIHSVTLAPSVPVLGQDWRATVNYDNPVKDSRVTLIFRWYRDGQLLKDYSGDTLPGSEVQSGSSYYVEVKATNGAYESEWFTTGKVAALEEHFKFTRLMIDPEHPTMNDTLQVTPECENCEGTKLHYRWYVNEKIAEGADDAQFSAPDNNLKPGDSVRAEVWPEIENQPAIWSTTNTVAIQARQVEALPGTKISIENGTVNFTFRVSNPDAEQIDFELVKAPQGASLNASGSGGTVSWTIPQGFTGPVEFQVKAKNASGAETMVRGSTTISSVKTPAPAQGATQK